MKEMKEQNVKIYYHEERGFLYSESGWPEQPVNVCRQCDGKGWITGIERPCSCNPGGEWRSSKTALQRYHEALQKSIINSVAFEDQKRVESWAKWDEYCQNSGYRQPKGFHEIQDTIKCKSGQFYQIPFQKVEVIEACTHESCPVDAGCEHCKEPVKVARFKVPAPTVATDNSGEPKGERINRICAEILHLDEVSFVIVKDWILTYKDNFHDVLSKSIKAIDPDELPKHLENPDFLLDHIEKAKMKVTVASPVEEEQYPKSKVIEMLDKALSYGYHVAKDEAKGIPSIGYGSRFMKLCFPEK